MSQILRGMFRSRRLLDLAHRIESCQNCGRHIEGCEPAHSNEPEHGKGAGLKSHDCFFAALCHTCHAWYDNRGGYGMDPSGRFQYSERAEMFTKAMHATWLSLWQSHKLRAA